MSRRYASVDRSKEIKAKREVNPFFKSPNLKLYLEEFNINNILSTTKKSGLKTLNPTKIEPKKLPLINIRAAKAHISEINSKTSDFSTELNNTLSMQYNSNEKNTNFKTEANNDKNNDSCFKIIINSNFNDKSFLNKNQTLSINKILKTKLNINKDIKERNDKMKYPPILRSERLYPKIIKDKNSMNIFKKIKSIRNNNLRLKNNKNKHSLNKDQLKKEYIAYNSKFQDIVFDSNKLLNNYYSNAIDLDIKDDIDSFIAQKKELLVNNRMIEIIKKENKNLKEKFENRNKAVDTFQKIIEKDEKDFEIYSDKQKMLYYKISDLSDQIHRRNYNLIALLYLLRSRSKTLEDEIFKIIEQIESLRIYAKFVHKVLGGNEKLFDGELIPDYGDNTRPDISQIVNKVYEKYGNLLKKHKQSMASNTYYTINNEERKKINNEIKTHEETNIEEIDFELLDDPLFMVKKYKDIEDRILHFVEVQENFNKYANKESDLNNQFIKELKLRITKLESEYEYSKNRLKYFKNMGKTMNQNENKDFFSLIKDLSENIFTIFNNKNTNGILNKLNSKNLDIFELSDVASLTIDLIINKELEVNQYISNLETYEKEDKNLFSEVMNARKNEIKFLNQNKNLNNINNEDFIKMRKVQDKYNKIIIKSKRSEPPYYKMKKKEVVKIDINEIVNKENTELLIYK